MLAVSRFRFETDDTSPAVHLTACLRELKQRPGFRSGVVGRALDDERLWVLQTSWDSVGAYRRAVSSYDVKIAMAPVMARVVDEPSAFEVVAGPGATKPNESQPRGTLA